MHSRVDSLAIAAAFILLTCSLAAQAQAMIHFDIPAQPLADSLRAVGSQANTNILFDPPLVAGRKARALKGDLTAEQALSRLLAGTGIKFSFMNETTVVLAAQVTTHAPAAGDPPTSDQKSPAAKDEQKEGKNGSSDGFRLAQVDQGASLQSSAVENRTSTSELKPAGLEEVVVTAQRREEKLGNVPMSLTALTQKAMDDLNVQSFSDLATVVPGLVLTTPATLTVQSYSDVAIRGIFSGGNAATTGIYIDETPIAVREIMAAASSGSPQPDIFDLDRVEVLRGPQGTLFGSSAMGGAIRYITPQPSLDTASGYSKAELGFTDRGSSSYGVGVAYGAPIIAGEAGFRLSGWFHSDGGFIDLEDPYTGELLKRNANSSHSYTLRPAFTVVPTEGLTITPAIFIQHRRSAEPDSYWVTLVPDPEPGKHVSGFGAKVPQSLRDDLTVPSLAIKYDFHGASLQSDTSYVDRSFSDFDDWSHYLETFFGVPPVAPSLSSFSSYEKEIVWTRAYQQEFRLTSQDSGSRLTWVAGAYYRHGLDGVSQYIAPDLTPVTEYFSGMTSLQYFGVPDYVVNGQPFNSYDRFTTVTEQKAVFGDITYAIVPRLKADLGLRVEHSAVEQQQEIFAGPLLGTAYTSLVLPDQTQNPITPRFGLTYHYTDQNMVYASAAKGYRTGGSNSPIASEPLCDPSLAALGLKAAPTNFDSDSLWSYEIGTKGSLFAQRVVFQASAFYINWTGIQTTISLPSCGQNFTANRGKAISEGLDFQAAVVVTDGLTVSGNVGYDHAYQPDAVYGPPVNGVRELLVGAGDLLGGVPPWSASLHAEYSRNINRLWEGAQAYIRVDYRWLDAYPKGDPRVAQYDPGTQTVFESLYYPQAAYEIVNFHLGVTHRGLDLSAFVNNATNSDPVLGVSHATIGDPLYSATAIRPLTVGITALYRF